MKMQFAREHIDHFHSWIAKVSNTQSYNQSNSQIESFQRLQNDAHLERLFCQIKLKVTDWLSS